MFTGSISLGGVDLYDEYGVIAVQIGGGMAESHFGITQSILEEKMSTVDIPHFFGVERKPFQFSLTFAREKKWDYKTKESFARLLFKPFYQELASPDLPQVIYKVICIDEPLKILNGLEQGYMTFTFRTDAPWAWSTVTTRTVDVVAAPYNLDLENKSNILDVYYPEIEFTTSGTTEFRISNDRDISREFVFTGLVDGETVYVDNEKKRILSDQPYPFKYRLSNFNRNWLRLKYGINNITINSPCTVEFKMQYPIAI